MSAETIVIKNPAPNFPENTVKFSSAETNSKLLITTLWLFSSIFSAAKIDFNANITGISIGFNLQDVILVTLTAWMLHRGFTSRTVALIFPWVSATMYSLYYNHYKSLSRMIRILRHVKHATALPWIALFAATVGLVLRVVLVLRILQLSANLWYRKKLEKELYNPLN
ncbi:unnamed protein product [Psylliodes chrysocephalus]|uniref:Uncharacterized protein n=1 Tax=Psylliodes chrysocephalus TaxID=3402493 RepID=A0A9P0D5E5_9CUCU|nr:unnamed protein product [Psylliodes chrysocephala]